MLLPITVLYAGILMPIMAYLGFKIGSLRGSTGISMNNQRRCVARRHGPGLGRGSAS